MVNPNSKITFGRHYNTKKPKSPDDMVSVSFTLRRDLVVDLDRICDYSKLTRAQCMRAIVRWFVSVDGGNQSTILQDIRELAEKEALQKEASGLKKRLAEIEKELNHKAPSERSDESGTSGETDTEDGL